MHTAVSSIPMDVSTFKEDLLGLDSFAKRLEQFISVEHRFISGGLVIGLSSKFGTGKSTFLRMWKDSIENTRTPEERVLVVTISAWESDYYGDPLFAIVSELAKKVEAHGESSTKLIEAAKDFGWFATAISGQIVNKLTGIDAVSAGEFAENKRSQRSASKLPIPDAFSIYESRKDAMASLKAAIRAIVLGDKPKVLFLIDELDRCRPDYAIAYLETIKHIFDIRGAVFIVAADRHHLMNSAKAAFGKDLDFDEYYRKFIHREVKLPRIPDISYQKLASNYAKFYLEQEEVRTCGMELDAYRIQNISELIAALKLTPRQIQEAFRILGHILESTKNQKGRLLWCLSVGSIMMSILKVRHIDVFHLLGTQGMTPKDALAFLRSHLETNSDWWFMLCLTGGGLKFTKTESVDDILVGVGLQKEGETYRGASQWYQGWGHSYSNRFTQIHERIEELSKWN